jgi:hypothetical protein
MATCCHCLLHNNTTTTIEEGDDIAAITFLATKLLEKATVVTVNFFCNKPIEEGDGSYRLLILFKHKECDSFHRLNTTT